MLNKYDGIFLLDVIEHIDDDAAFLRAALAHVKESVSSLLMFRHCMLFSNYDMAAGHKRRYSRNHLKNCFCKLALKPVRIQYWVSHYFQLLCSGKFILNLFRQIK